MRVGLTVGSYLAGDSATVALTVGKYSSSIPMRMAEAAAEAAADPR